MMHMASRSEIKEIEHLWISANGVKLAARCWLPTGPAPAVIEYIPYGKRWGTRSRDETLHRRLAQLGLACLRIDVRGTGESDGVMADEYSEQELADGEAAIAWVAAQPWCNGQVHLLGKSWGGFNALQLAARQPPALAGVVSVCASDDRHANDAHYMGDCTLVENHIYGSLLFALAIEPPSPALRPDDWRDSWLGRLREARPFELNWLSHPTADDYWATGSIRPDYAAVRCPVFVVGGWADAYTDGAVRLAVALPRPVRVLIGPWAHTWPHTPGGIGPRVAFPELVAQWIHGDDREQCVVWIDQARGGGFHTIEPHRLEGDDRIEWRPANEQHFPDRSHPQSKLVLRSPESVGAAGGSWCPFDLTEMPGDQRPDDAASATFTSGPLEQPLILLGQPRFQVDVSAPGPAFLCARLVELRADGSAHRLAWGVARLQAGATTLQLKLSRTGVQVPAGHRVRLSLSSAYWPIIWPEQRGDYAVTVDLRDAALSLPVLRDLPPAQVLPDALPAAHDPVVELSTPGFTRSTDRRGNRSSLTIRNGLTTDGRLAMRRLEPIGTEIGFGVSERHAIAVGDPLSAVSTLATRFEVREAGVRLTVLTASRLTADAECWRLQVRVVARENGHRIHAARWDERIPRRG